MIGDIVEHTGSDAISVCVYLFLFSVSLGLSELCITMDPSPPHYLYPSTDAFRPHGGPSNRYQQPHRGRGGGRGAGFVHSGRGGRGGGFVGQPRPQGYSASTYHSQQRAALAALPPPSRLSQCPRSAFLVIAHPTLRWVENLSQLSSSTTAPSIIEGLQGIWFPMWPNSTVGEIALRAVQCRWQALSDAYQSRRREASHRAPLSSEVLERETQSLAGGTQTTSPAAAVEESELDVQTGDVIEHAETDVAAHEEVNATGAGELPQVVEDTADNIGPSSDITAVKSDRLPKTLSIALHAVFLSCSTGTDEQASSVLSAPLRASPLVLLHNVTLTRVNVPRPAPVTSADEGASSASPHFEPIPIDSNVAAAAEQTAASELPTSISELPACSKVEESFDEALVLRRDHEGNKRTLSSYADVAAQFANGGASGTTMLLCASIHSMHW
jgi:hypothetical protein